MRKITQQILILAILFTTLSCNGQDKTVKKDDTVKLKINIINVLPIGWGNKYQARVEKVIEGEKKDFNDTILFGITANREYEYLNIGDTCIITFHNSKEINSKKYFPPINGTLNKKNQIWLITKINNLTRYDMKRTFVGTAIVSDGKPMFVWDFAYSQAFYIDGLDSWDVKYLNKKIKIEGVLVDYIDGLYSGPVIKNWKILDDK